MKKRLLILTMCILTSFSLCACNDDDNGKNDRDDSRHQRTEDSASRRSDKKEKDRDGIKKNRNRDEKRNDSDSSEDDEKTWDIDNDEIVDTDGIASEDSDMELYEQYLNGEIGAYHYGNYEYFAPDDEDFAAIRYDEDFAYEDIDNDGKVELTLWGPYGGFFLDAQDGELYVLEEGEGTAETLDYIYRDGEVWLVREDVTHTGRAWYRLYKYDGNGNIDSDFTLYSTWEDENGDDCTYYLDDEEITKEEYELLINSFSYER